MKKVNVLVLTGFGLNCDHETAYTFELAGAIATRVHINSLIRETIRIDDFQIIVIGGGFSWGDDHGAGVVQAVSLKTNAGEKIIKFVEKGNLVLGICNGFQTLVNMGLLPGFKSDYKTRAVALTYNDCGKFRDDWVTLKVNSASPCPFLKGLDLIDLPIRHGEGKFYSNAATIQRLFDNNQVALQYAMPNGMPANGKFPYNPNGSLKDIAGICDQTGRIFGLMPHPEAYNHWTNHPGWTRIKEKNKREASPAALEATIGLRIFQNAVNFIQNKT